MAKMSASRRYAAARQLLLRNPLVLAKYYNAYRASVSVKVYYYSDFALGYRTKAAREHRLKLRALHRALVALADDTFDGINGGTVYTFKVRKAGV